MATTSAQTSATAAATQAAAVSSKELMEVIETCLATPIEGYPGHKKEEVLWGAPLLIEGIPGTAKTARIKQVAAGLKADLHIFFAAPHPPESFAGALIPDGKGGAINIVALHELRSVIEAGTGILFLDELNGAAPATQGAIQSLIHERKSGGSSIPGEIRIIAAQNPEEIATAGFRLAPAVANRFMHVEDVGPSAAEWVAWSVGGNTWDSTNTLESLVDTITRQWPTVWPEVQGLFAGFIDRHPTQIHAMPDISDPRSGKAWPSHRTWDFARRVWCTQRIMGRSEIIAQALIESAVGPGAAGAFMTYALATKIPAPMEVLRGNWAVDVNRLDIVLAAYSAAVAYVIQRPDEKDRHELAPLAWKALQRLFEVKMEDIVVPSVQNLLGAKLGRNSGVKAIIDQANKVLVPLNAAGLVALAAETT